MRHCSRIFLLSALAAAAFMLGGCSRSGLPSEDGSREDSSGGQTVTPTPEITVEPAAEAVRGMKTGWNLYNTLDATAAPGLGSERSWGQPYTTPDLIQFIAEAGFGVVRVPVTWWNHMDSDWNVDPEWMERVAQVVGYVLDAGLYCILNVHHDTGDGPQWLHADYDRIGSINSRFQALWSQIAGHFRDYGGHLLFEAYNEILDEGNNWNFAQNPKAYDAVNTLAQTFVNTVRATGGGNSSRNLVINTYAAATGGVSWTADHDQVVANLKIPEDSAEGHLIVEVHSYDPYNWGVNHGKFTDGCLKVNADMFERMQKYFISKGIPVIIGEFGPSGGDSHSPEDCAEQVKYVNYFVSKAREYGIGTCAWMDYLDGVDRLVLRWTRPDLAETALKAWYGDSYILPHTGFESWTVDVSFSNQWAEYCLYTGDGLDMDVYKGFRLELSGAPAAGDFQIKMQTAAQFSGEVTSPDGQYPTVTGAVTGVIFDRSRFDGNVLWNINLQACRSDLRVSVKRMVLLRHDGTEEEIPTGVDGAHSGWGCSVVSAHRNN